MHLFYSTDRKPEAQAVQALLKQTTWADERSTADIQTMLKNSITAGAWNGETLVGFARAFTDGRFRAVIEDVIVDERYRKQGIGRGLLELLLSELEGIEQILLLCEDYNIEFYEQFGFEILTMSIMHRWRGD